MAKKKITADDLDAFSAQPNGHAESKSDAEATREQQDAAPVSAAGADATATLSDLVRDLNARLAENQRELVHRGETEARLREENAGLRAQLDAERDRRRRAEKKLKKEQPDD